MQSNKKTVKLKNLPFWEKLILGWGVLINENEIKLRADDIKFPKIITTVHIILSVTTYLAATRKIKPLAILESIGVSLFMLVMLQFTSLIIFMFIKYRVVIHHWAWAQDQNDKPLLKSFDLLYILIILIHYLVFFSLGVYVILTKLL